MVALQVVHERMLKSGLSDLCLELHSKNTNKKSFLNALHVTLQNARNDESINDDVSGLKEMRDKYFVSILFMKN